MISPLVTIQQVKGHAGMTEAKHLYNAFLTNPAKATHITRLAATETAMPIEYLTGGMMRKEEIGSVDYTWMLETTGERAIKVVVNLEASTVSPGVNHSLMRVVFPEKWFGRGDILNPDNNSRRYQVQVALHPTPHPMGWLYTLKFATPNSALVMPQAYLTPGSKFAKEFHAASEYDEPSEATHTMPFQMRNCITTSFKQDTITRTASKTLLEYTWSNPEKPGETTTLWSTKAEWDLLLQFFTEQERSYWYSQYNRKPNGESVLKSAGNRPIFIGAGIHQQIAPANTREYVELSKDILQDLIADMSFNQLGENNRHFVGFTGEYGFMEFSNAMSREAATYNLVDSKFVTGSGNNLTLSGQFKTWEGPNGMKITLKKMPLYDSELSGEVHYRSGRPLSSYDFTFLNFGTTNGKSNITKMYRKDSERVMWSNDGSINSRGETAKSFQESRGSTKDGCTVLILAESGVKIENPLSCGRLICTAAA